MNKEVNFQIAKLLKEKGFDEVCQKWYSVEGGLYYQDEFDNNRGFIPVCECEAPTITEVVMWLYKKHGIWMNVSPVFEFNSGRNDYLTIRGFQYYITVITDNKYNQEKSHAGREYKNSPTEAYEAAINHTLKNLL